jgi:hypothetical protein
MRILLTDEKLADKLFSKDFEVVTPNSNIQFTINQINNADVVLVAGDINWDTLGVFWNAVYSKKPTIVIDSLKESTWRDYFAAKVVADIEEALPILYRWRAEGKFPK